MKDYGFVVDKNPHQREVPRYLFYFKILKILKYATETLYNLNTHGNMKVLLVQGYGVAFEKWNKHKYNICK